MSAGETKGVVLAVNCNVFLVATLELLDRSLNVLHTTLLAHLSTGEIAVKTGSVPVTWDWLGVERNLGTKLFRDAVEEEAGQPKVITHCNGR